MRSPLLLLTLCVATSAWAGLSPKQIYRRMAPGVVFIAAQEDGSNTSNCGTGSILTSDGEVLTNAHVVVDKATGKPYGILRVCLKPAEVTGDLTRDLAQSYSAQVLAYDRAMDLALLRIKGAPAKLTRLTLGNSGDLSPGDETVAIGHPEQGGLWTLTTGVLSDQIQNQGGVQGRDTWQMETSLNRGNSGGPLFDSRGYVIGVNTAIARRADDGLAITGINFAIKSSSARTWLASHGLNLAFGSIPLDDKAIDAAYGLAPSSVAAPTTLAAAVPTQAPTASSAPVKTPTPQAKAVVALAEVPTALPTPLATATPHTDADSDADSGQAEPAAPVHVPVHFVMDLEQSVHPYNQGEISDFLRALTARRDAAIDELDQETGGR